MKPVQFEGVNTALVSNNDDIEGLPAYRGKGIYISLWRPSLRERLSMLFFGKAWLAILGDIHPPVSITAGRSAVFHYQPGGAQDEDTDRNG